MKTYIIIGAVLLLGFIFLPSVYGETKYSKFKSEIDRIASSSNIQPSSVVCRNVSGASICYAEYASLSIAQAKQMLISNGFTLVDEQFNKNGRVSATNKNASMRVDSEASSSTSLTLKYKDIDVTL